MSDFKVDVKIAKIDEERRQVFGIFSLVEKNGELIFDGEDEAIPVCELEKAAYDHVLNARIAGENHVRKGVGTLIESFVFTKEKIDALTSALAMSGVVAKIDIPAVGWWGGYHVHDDKVWKAVQSGEYSSFSIGGSVEQREDVE